MSNQFDSYINQLKELELSDNKATLSSFVILNKSVLSYFKGIWEPLQTILQSSHVDTNIINEIKPILFQLAEIKDTYESLKANACRECEDEILQFQKQIDIITVSTYSFSLAKLKELYEKNSKALKASASKKRSNESESRWANVRDWILRGELPSMEDIFLAEEHVSEGATLPFFKNLALKTKKANILNKIYTNAQEELSPEEWVELLWTLVRSGVSYDRKDDVLIELLNKTSERDSLLELGKYCNNDKTRSIYLSRLEATDKRDGSRSTKVLLIILFIAAVIAFFIFFV